MTSSPLLSTAAFATRAHPTGTLPTRRTALAGCVAALATARRAAAGPEAPLAFEALRNGHRIGEHRVAFEHPEGGLVVRSVASFVVRLGPIPLYRYHHASTEWWVGDQLSALEAVTNQNGRLVKVSVHREGAGLRIQGPSGVRLMPGQAAPFSHWNPALARRPLFNPQDGGVIADAVSGPFPASITLADGSRVPGKRLSFRGQARIDDDYDLAGRWGALEGTLADGSRLEYRRL